MDSQEYLKTADILYVEDEPEVREGYAKALSRYAKHLYVAQNGEEGLELFEKYKPDIVISDIRMPKLGGIEMAKKIKEQKPGTAVIFTSAHNESKYLFDALDIQADGYLLKPVTKNKLKEKIASLSKIIYLEKKEEE